MTQTIRRGPVAIVAAGPRAHLDTGETRDFPINTPELHPEWLMKGAAHAFEGQPEGVLILERPFPAYAAPQLRDAGWQYTSMSDTLYTSFRRPNTPTVHVGILGTLMGADSRRVPLNIGEPDAPELARRLGKYHRLLGVPWQGTAGMNGIAHVRSLYTSKGRGEQPLWRGEEPRAKRGQPRVRGTDALVWHAPELPARDEYRWVHLFDTRASYAAAAGVTELPWTRLKPTGGVPFDRTWPGYWLVPTHQLPEYDIPIFDQRWAFDGAVWLTTETMALLLDLGHSPDVIDSHTTPMRRRLLKPWADSLRDALDTAERGADRDPVMRKAIKATWTETVGMFGRAQSRIHRPEWREMVIDRARANLTRKILSAVKELDYHPVRVKTDAVWFASKSPLPRRIPGEGHQVGRLVYKGSRSLSDYLEEYPHV